VEPRDLWERHTVLAQAFCFSDDEVRHAQSVLDHAQADRTRTLAAFAVTVGSDGAVADMMGLNEREVRLARRTVGKDDARNVAEELLASRAPAAPEPEPEPEPVETAEPEHGQAAAYPPVPEPGTEVPLPGPRTEASATASAQHQQQAQEHQQPPAAHVTGRDQVHWTPAMDSVLLWSWQSGLDLQTVAAELGFEPRDLLLRAQQLAAEGRLTPRPPTDGDLRAGRHRRDQSLHVPDSPEGLYAFTPYS
jgi:hypothetical protein